VDMAVTSGRIERVGMNFSRQFVSFWFQNLANCAWFLKSVAGGMNGRTEDQHGRACTRRGWCLKV